MNDLEFVLTDAGVNYPNIPENQILWIKEKLIPYYEFYTNSLNCKTHFIQHSKTKECRTFKGDDIISMLKNL